jgi:translation initiation factor RLI1
MAQVKTLDMSFKNEAGKISTISIPDVNDSVTEVEATAAMDLIISKNIFATSGGDLVEKVTAQVVTRDTEVLFTEE